MALPGPGPTAPVEGALIFELLRTVEATSGEALFRSVVRGVAQVLGVEYAVVAELLPPQDQGRVRSLAFWGGGKFQDNVEWAVSGTPCAPVIAGELNHHPSGLQQAYPENTALGELGAVSYLGVPLSDARGGVLGHLFVLDTKPMPAVPSDLAAFKLFAARAAAELGRIKLEKALAESEERFRDLFDEAPIAYVHEDLDSRFIRANRTAMRILGITPDQVDGMVGKSFAPDTPDAQKRMKEAFESIGRGTDTSGMVLELVRKNDGRHIFIQWWSRPDPSGSYTRTMFLDITDQVLMAHEQARLKAENVYLSEEVKAAHHFEEIVGSSPSLAKALEKVKRVAATETSVLITGETGTGKELIARAIHNASPRKDRPFIKLNCAALPTELVESELFGHEKGAFSGAIARRVGRFELADGGTIFLDEIGEAPPAVQVKLLRVLQESELERVGGAETIKVNVRVLAATNRDLAAEMTAGRFRSDLYYRLNVFPIHVPPLRERGADIRLIAEYFVTRISAGLGKRIEEIDPATVERLVRYPWPGNIRELHNVIERAVILTEGPTLSIDEGEIGAPGARAEATPAAMTLDDMERAHIRAVLAQTGGAVAGPTGAAKILGVPPSTLRSRMERLGIKL